EPSEMRRERNCPVSLSPLSVHPLRPAFRPGLLIVSLGEVVAAQWWGGGIRLSHNSDVTKSSSHLSESIQNWLRLTAVWPASCLTIAGKQRETGSKHGRIYLLTEPGHRVCRHQRRGVRSGGR
ncbi:hypothetical protein JOQ06_010794, partial [Pogonophryne albipinna]